MDSLRKSIEKLAVNFTSRMDEFQKEVRKSSNSAASPSLNFNEQFQVFRTFVMTALENLQLQLQLLCRQQDDMEVRSRRKMLLVHGVQEPWDVTDSQCISKLLAEKLNILRCHRMGRTSSEKHRPVLVKFRDQNLRDKAWFAKTKMKGSGVTLTEFLTRRRHEAFVLARRRYGVSQTWTRDGSIIVLGPDGKRNRVVSVAEVEAIASPARSTSGPSATSVNPPTSGYVNTKPRKLVNK